MVNGGGEQQDPVVERLLRLELEIKASNQRGAAENKALNERFAAEIAASNQRVTDVMNVLMESIRQTNTRIDETNTRISETNTRIDVAAQDAKREFDRLNDRIDKLFYVMIGVGAAVIATLVAGQIVG